MFVHEPPPGSRQSAPTSLVVQSVVRPKRVAFLFDKAKATFTFIASQDVLTYPGDERITDLDLMVLLDGELVIGEVKSNARGFDAASVAAMVKVAKVMLPDTVIFAAEADGATWPTEVAVLLDNATTELTALRVTVRRELLRWLP